MPGPSLVQIGVITGAHGVRGQVKIRRLSGDPDTLFSARVTNASGRHVRLSFAGSGSKGAIIAAVEGISDRNAAEALKGTALYAPADALPPEEQRRHALTGAEARLESGRVYGRVTGFYDFGAGEIVEIALAAGGTEMLPFAAPFVRQAGGHLIVSPLEYVEAEDKDQCE